MTTYSTQNPIGSTDPRDLYDNAENLDNLVNGGQPFYDDRLGESRKSWAGMEQDFAGFLTGSGYQFLGDYAAGITVTAYNQIIRADGEFWRAAAGTELPYTATGAGMPEGGAFAAVGDAVLRQDLANPDKGTAMVARGVVAVDSIADLLALPEEQRKEGLRYLVKGYHAGSDVGGGEFHWDVNSTKDSDGGMVLGEGDTGRWFRVPPAELTPQMFGAVGDGIADDTAAFRDMLSGSNDLYIPKGHYRILEGLELPWNTRIVGHPEGLLDFRECTDGELIRTKDVELLPLPSLSVDLKATDRVVSFTEPHNLKRGDMVVLYVPEDGSWDASRPSYRKGERFLVAAAPTALSVELQGSLFDSYPAASTEMYVHERVVTNHIEGIHILGAPSTTTPMMGLALNKDVNGSVLNVRINDASYIGLYLNQCFGTTVTGGEFTESQDDTAGGEYGISVGNSQYITVTGSYVSSQRHGAAVGGSSGAGCGVNYAINFIGCTITSGGTANAADMHTNTAYSSYHKCTINGSVGYGGKGNSVTDCIIIESSTGHPNDMAVMLSCHPSTEIEFSRNKVIMTKERTNVNANPAICLYNSAAANTLGLTQIKDNEIHFHNPSANNWGIIGASLGAPSDAEGDWDIAISGNSIFGSGERHSSAILFRRSPPDSKSINSIMIENNTIISEARNPIWVYGLPSDTGFVAKLCGIKNNSISNSIHAAVMIEKVEEVALSGNTIKNFCRETSGASSTNAALVAFGCSRLVEEGNITDKGEGSVAIFRLSAHDVETVYRGSYVDITPLEDRFSGETTVKTMNEARTDVVIP